jgi:predicted TIM-barrel fold metal-dependent hydrolase
MPTMDYDCGPSRAEGQASVIKLLAAQDAAGIELTCVKPQSDDPPDNRWLNGLIKENGSPRLVGVAIVNPRRGEEALADLEEAVRDFGFRGLKLMPTVYGYPIESPVVDPVMRKAAELGIPVTIHSGGIHCMPSEIALLAARHPDVPIIMDHMGYRYYVEQAIAAAKVLPNIYLGTATANNEPGNVLRAMREIGPERVVYGSNWPASYPDLAVAALERLDLDPAWRRMLMGDTLARLYRL